MRRALKLAAKVSLGLMLGLIATEALFWLRDDGAFPHLNVYAPHPTLGVSLRPGATQRVAFGGNPTTSVRINSRGFRGEEWGPPAAKEAIVLGDSQVFGLGVEEGQTFSAGVEALLDGWTVRNAGVPTHGPAEYLALAEALVVERKPQAVVLTMNMLNDLFEASRPNTERHAVWDGWAVRTESAPERIVDFPGRELLYRQSHTFYALRRFLHQRGPDASEPSFASEGGLADLTRAADDRNATDKQLLVENEQRKKGRQTEIGKLSAELGQVKRQIENELLEANPDFRDEHRTAFLAATANPGDIVGNRQSESSRTIQVTAEVIREGAALRRKWEAILRDPNQAPGGPAQAKKIREAIEKREALLDALAELQHAPLERLETWTPLLPWIERFQRLCDENGARLIVLVLPIDVQVSAKEWAKYGRESIDMTPTRVLNQDVVRSAELIGVTAVDPLSELESTETAFLDRDIHLTPKGHAAVARALVAGMKALPPTKRPAPGLPSGRTRVPPPGDWLREPESLVVGSTRAGCETQQIREWLRVTCRRQGRSVPTGVTVLQGGRGEAMTLAVDGQTTLVAPVLDGDELIAEFTWTDRTQRLHVSAAPVAARASRSFLAPTPPNSERVTVSKADEALCACHRRQTKEEHCGELYGEADHCVGAFENDCYRFLACARGAAWGAESCAEGTVPATATGRCVPLCGEGRPCATGTCTEWMGGRVCL